MIVNLKPKDRIPAGIETLKQLSADDLCYIREGCHSSIPLSAEVEPNLAEAIRYVLSSEGSMMRAQLGFVAMRAAGATREEARNFGVAVEYFHTASLLFDDLPAMDGATYRRGRLCPHIKFSEADSTLASLALITHGYDLMFSLLLAKPLEQAEAARKVMTNCLGVQGILSGQAADVHYDGVTADGDSVLAIAEGKTGTLLRLLLCFPARLYGLPRGVSEHLNELAENWGYTYQVLDDFKDCLESESESGKTVRRDATLDRPNFLIKAGRDVAWNYLTSRLASTNELVRDLAAADAQWVGLGSLQSALEGRAVKLGQALKSNQSVC